MTPKSAYTLDPTKWSGLIMALPRPSNNNDNGYFMAPTSPQPTVLTKPDKHIHFKTHTPHAHTRIHTTHTHIHIPPPNTHTHTHGKNRSIVVMGLMETEERK